MPEAALYLIAQYVADPFRREARNVGVIVMKDGDVAAKFYGEQEPGRVDGRSLTWFKHPNVYRKWVQHWRETIEEGNGTLVEDLMAHNGANYNIIRGGDVARTGDDAPGQVCDFLYPLLVGKPAPIKPLERVEAADASQRLFRREISQEFKKLGITGPSSRDVPNPVWAEKDVQGKRVVHKPAFVQQANKMWIMESVNFSTTKRTLAKDHAGWVAKMFDDIREADPSRVEPIVLVQATKDDLQHRLVDYSMRLLTGSGTIIQWGDDRARVRFFRERDSIARSLTIN